MILILSSDHYEQGTEGVIDWLLYYGHPFLRLSANTLLSPHSDFQISVHDARIKFNGCDLTGEVGAVFYRRFQPSIPFHDLGNLQRSQQLQRELQGEARRLTSFLADSLADKFWLPGIAAADRAANKLSTLNVARRCGLTVPRSHICRSQAEVTRLISDNPEGWITKPIEYCGYYTRDQFAYTTFTSRLAEHDLPELPARFHPSLLQECVTPWCEVRSFYLMGKFYSEATITTGNTTEADHTTFADIKLKGIEAETSYVPYQLPPEIEQKLHRLMQELSLNTGSIDLMVTAENEYYFLEVNPAGQFSAPSERANFQLERRVAEALIEKDRCHATQAI